MVNEWVTHVKQWSARNKMSYGCAISDPRCKRDYQIKKGKTNPVRVALENFSMGEEDKLSGTVREREREKTRQIEQERKRKEQEKEEKEEAELSLKTMSTRPSGIYVVLQKLYFYHEMYHLAGQRTPRGELFSSILKLKSELNDIMEAILDLDGSTLRDFIVGKLAIKPLYVEPSDKFFKLINLKITGRKVIPDDDLSDDDWFDEQEKKIGDLMKLSKDWFLFNIDDAKPKFLEKRKKKEEARKKEEEAREKAENTWSLADLLRETAYRAEVFSAFEGLEEKNTKGFDKAITELKELYDKLESKVIEKIGFPEEVYDKLREDRRVEYEGEEYDLLDIGDVEYPPTWSDTHVTDENEDGIRFLVPDDGTRAERKVTVKAWKANQMKVYKRLAEGVDETLTGGAITGKEVKKMVSASYEDKKGSTKKIGDFKLDTSLSNKKAKVYHNPETNETVVAHRGTKGTISDWSNNLVYGITGSKGYKKTDRYKQAKKTQKKAIEKYGEVSNVGHSQGAEIARELNKEGLSKSVIMVNPASRGEKVRKNETVIKSSLDPVSILVPKGKNVNVIEAKSYNPLSQHSAKIIRKGENEKLYGGANFFSVLELIPQRYM